MRTCYLFFSRRILELCPTLTVGNFFKSTFLFICSTTSNLNNFEPQQLEPQKRVQNENITTHKPTLLVRLKVEPFEQWNLEPCFITSFISGIRCAEFRVPFLEFKNFALSELRRYSADFRRSCLAFSNILRQTFV